MSNEQTSKNPHQKHVDTVNGVIQELNASVKSGFDNIQNLVDSFVAILGKTASDVLRTDAFRTHLESLGLQVKDDTKPAVKTGKRGRPPGNKASVKVPKSRKRNKRTDWSDEILKFLGSGKKRAFEIQNHIRKVCGNENYIVATKLAAMEKDKKLKSEGKFKKKVYSKP